MKAHDSDTDTLIPLVSSSTNPVREMKQNGLLNMRSSFGLYELAVRPKKMRFIARPLLLVIFFIILFISAFAQPDTVRISHQIERAAQFLVATEGEKQDLDSANWFLRQALALSRSIHSQKWLNVSMLWTGTYYMEANYIDSARTCFQQVISYYETKGDKEEEANAWSHYGNSIPSFKKAFAPEKASRFEKAYQLYWQAGDSLKALESLKAAADARLYEPNLDLAEKELLTVAANYKAMHFPDIHFTYDLLRVISVLKGDLVKEVFYTMEMVRSVDSAHLKTLEDSMQAGRLYSSAGTSYANAAMWDRSLSFAKKGWSTLQFTSNNEEYFGRLATLCIAFVRNDSAQVAFKLLQTCLRERQPSSAFQNARVTYVSGICYEALGEFRKAEMEFSKIIGILVADKLWDEPRHLQWRQEMMIVIGNFFLHIHKYKEANFYTSQLPTSYTYLTTLGQRGRIERLKSRVDSAMGRYHTALQHFATYQLMNDSLFGIQKTIQIQDLEVRYALDKKDNDIRLQGANIKLLTKENELQQLQVGKSRNLRNMMTVALLFSLVLIGMFYNRYRVKQQKNKQLELKQDEITAKNKQLEQLLLENEWLLQEVHHRVKNNLQTVTSLLTSQMASTEKGPAVDAIRESRQRIEAIAMIHQRLYNSNNYSSILMPTYVADLVENLREAFNPGSRIIFSLEIEPIALDISVALPVALILNEAISNALKHAFPGETQGTITIDVRRISEDKMMLEVNDDGIGFSVKAIDNSKSFGIRLIKGLASEISGESHIVNGNGTTIRVSFGMGDIANRQNKSRMKKNILNNEYV